MRCIDNECKHSNQPSFLVACTRPITHFVCRSVHLLVSRSVCWLVRTTLCSFDVYGRFFCHTAPAQLLAPAHRVYPAPCFSSILLNDKYIKIHIYSSITLISDASGCSAALFVGFILTYSNLGFFASLLTFFLVGSKATKYKSSIKKTFESDHKEGEGQRNWVQVLCNGGIPTQLATMLLLFRGPGEFPLEFFDG